jgi:hypothetical protein
MQAVRPQFDPPNWRCRPTAAASDQRYRSFGSVVNFHKQTAPDTELKHSAERESWGQQGTSGGSQNLAAQSIKQR